MPGPAASQAGHANVSEYLAALDALFSAGDIRMEARSFTNTGVNVAAFVDMNDATHTWAVAGTLPVPTRAVGFGNALTVKPTGSQSAYSSRVAANWKFASDGTSWTSCSAFKGTAGSVYGSSFGSTQPSSELNIGVGNVPNFMVRQSFSPAVNVVSSTTLGDTTNPSYVVCQYGSAASPQWSKYQGATLLASGAQLNTPSAAAPAPPMQLFGIGNTSNRLVGEWALSYWFKRILSASELTVLQNGMKALVSL